MCQPKALVTKRGAIAEFVISAPQLNLFDGWSAAGMESAAAEVGVLAQTEDWGTMILRAEGEVFAEVSSPATLVTSLVPYGLRTRHLRRAWPARNARYDHRIGHWRSD